MRIETKIGLVSLAIIGIAAACGGRSGTEIFGYGDLSGDAATGGAGGTAGTGGGVVDGGAGGTTGGTGGGTGGGVSDASEPDVLSDVSLDVHVPPDAAPDGRDLFDALPPLPEGGPIGECVGCLKTKCGDRINACYNDPVCVRGVRCTVVQCALMGGVGGGGGGGAGGGGGQLDPACVFGCFDNDLNSVLTAVTMFTCITSNCGEACSLSGGGGAGAGGGRGGGAMLGLDFGSNANRGLFVPRAIYVGSTRVPRPEEVATAYPWLADVLSGRLPDPPPPCMANRPKN
ncbi:MAG: hypothetical protein MUF54_22145 [Polyangiaceae bacterium]|jgi:hypothetical protein|nr:hypothetical protein [Polyangiaceae bacterium]